jgi:hypothetical protein
MDRPFGRFCDSQGEMNKVTTIRQRFTAKTAALFLVLAFALSGTGLLSLAELTDTVRIDQSATATTINFQANGTKSLVVDFGLVERGDIKFMLLNLTNTGTGYVNVPLYLDGTDNDITNSTRVVFYDFGRGLPADDVPDASCTEAGAGAAGIIPTNWLTGASPVKTTPFWTGMIVDHGNGSVPGTQIPAGGHAKICAVYQIGGDANGPAFTAGGTIYAMSYRMPAFYP